MISLFNYVGDISTISHYIITEFLKNKNVAIDGTLGNGHDTDFLKDNFKKVYSFEIQEEPCKAYINKNIENVEVINDSHHLLKQYAPSFRQSTQ